MVKELNCLCSLYPIRKIIPEYDMDENEQCCDIRTLAKVPLKKGKELGNNKMMKKFGVLKESDRKQKSKF